MAKTILNVKIILFLSLLTVSVLPQSGEDFDATDEEAFLILDSDQESSGFYDQNGTTTNSSPPFDLLQTYFPLFIMIFDMPPKEKTTLEAYMDQKTYEKLKFNIDSKAKMYPEIVMKHTNISLDAEGNSNSSFPTNFDETTKLVVQGYHNASVYNAIRSVWLKQLRPFLPIIDQMAIMQYFAQRKAAETARMSLWSRIWQNLSMWMYGGHNPAKNECYAMEPKCVRAALEALSLEDRMILDKAANENQFDSVDQIIRNKLDEYQQSDQLDKWLHSNRPPKSLEALLDERTEVEEEALQRLRDHGIISSLKHYYKAVIEQRVLSEQDEIRQFFDTMNDTFARCFDPLRGQYHDF